MCTSLGQYFVVRGLIHLGEMKLYRLFIVMAGCCSAWAADVENSGLTPAQEKAVIEDWLAMQRAVADERSDWKIQKDFLERTLEVYESEREVLKSQILAAKTSQKKSELDADKAKLEQYKASAAKVEAVMKKLQPKFIALANQFPEILVATLVEELNLLEEETELGGKNVSEKLRAMVRVLREADRFQRKTTLVREEIVMAGEAREAEVVYFGFGRAFFQAGKVVGVGYPEESGWKWDVRSDIAFDVKLLIDVLEKGEQPQLVTLPIQVKP